jgi:prophage antirepressor-like protein
VTTLSFNIEKKLSHFERWILVEAYQEILKAGTDQPTKTKQDGTKVHLLISMSCETISDCRFEKEARHKRGNMVIDGSAVDPKRPTLSAQL